MRRQPDDLLLGEWVCLGILCSGPTHGFAVAGRLRPGQNLGRVWAMSRALTYRALDQLLERRLIRVVGESPGDAGGPRTILAPTADGRRRLRDWLITPVGHLRDYRSELLLKILLATDLGVERTSLLLDQRRVTADILMALTETTHARGDGLAADTTGRDTAVDDLVVVWRREMAHAALRFIDDLLEPTEAPTPTVRHTTVS